MDRIELTEIDSCEWPDTIQTENYNLYGWETETIPDLTRNNFIFLIDKYNELVQYLQQKEKI